MTSTQTEAVTNAVPAALRPCPLCAAGSDGARPVLAQDGWRLVRCGCGFVFLQNPPALSAYQEEFDWHKSYHAATVRRRRQSPVLAIIDRVSRDAVDRLITRKTKLLGLAQRHIPLGRVLDAGCGGGWALSQLPARYVPFGIEFSRELAQRAQEAIAGRGGSIVCGDVLSCLEDFPDAHFSGIIMRSYLEHELEPLPVLQRSRRLLAPGGALILKVPNFGCVGRRVAGRHWSGFRWPEHVNYFTPATFQRSVLQAGYHVASFSLFDHFPFNDNMWLVATGG